MKRAASLLLCVGLCFAGLFAPASFAAAPRDTSEHAPPIRLTIPGRSVAPGDVYTAESNPWIQAYLDELNIAISPLWQEDGADERSLSEQLAVGVVPDLMPGLGRGVFEFAVRLGLAADLTDLIEEYASPLTKEILYGDGGYSIQCSTINGRVYALPHVYGNSDNVPVLWIREDWLEKLGLKAPTTAEELTRVLQAFVSQDPDGNGRDDTVGLCSTGNLWEFCAAFNMFGAQPFWSWYYGEDHTLRYSTVSFVPQIKNALAYLRDLYRQRLIHSEFAVLSAANYYKLFADSKAGVAFEYKHFPLHIQENTPGGQVTARWKAYPIPTGLPDGAPARPFSYHGPAAYNVVSSRCEHPEAAVQMLNLYVEKLYGSTKDEAYPIFVKDAQGNNAEDYAIFRTDIANDASPFEHVSNALLTGNIQGLSRSELDKYRQCKAFLAGDLTQWSAYQFYGPGNATITAVRYYTTQVTPFFTDYYGPEPLSISQQLELLNNRWRDTCIRIIMGSATVDAYDTYIDEWYQLGGEQIEKDLNALAATVSP